MSRKPSISAFLAAMIAAVALSGFLVYAASLALFARTESLRADAEVERLGAIIGSSVRAVLREPELILEVAAAVLSSGPSDPEGALSTVHGACGYFRSIMYLDADGIVRAVTPPSTVYAGADYSSAPFMADVRASRSVRWSSIYAGLDEGTREISIGLAMDGGVVFGILDFGALSARLAEVLGDSASGLSLADSGATLIVHKDRAKVDRREPDMELLERRFADPGADEYRFRRGSGRNAPLVIARRVPETGWFAVVERPAEFALEAFLESVPLVSVIAALLIGLSAGLFAVATRLLLRDVKAAGFDADKPGSGNASPMFFRETAAILSAARAAAERIRSKEEANQRLSALNARLEKALADLADAQSALVESEREAVRGMMAAAMAHELNTPIAAADSAAGEAERAALDVLAYAGENPAHSPAARSAAASLLEAVEAWDPESAPSGLDRRRLTREAEAMIAEALASAGPTNVAEPPGAIGSGRGSEGRGESYLEGGPDPAIFAGRLVDIGMTPSGSGALAGIGEALLTIPAQVASLLSTAEIVASCRVIRSGMAKAHSVVGAIKGYAAAEGPGGRVPVCVGTSVEDAVSLLYARTKKGVELRVEVRDDLWIDADPGVLHRIWMSLIANALDAIGYRGRIGISVYRDGGEAVVGFEDSGPAMPDELLAEVWTAEAGPRVRDLRGGTSLPSILRLVEMSGGTASCSILAGGTVFSVRFPVADGGAAGSGFLNSGASI